jgi:WD40 repeat protein
MNTSLRSPWKIHSRSRVYLGTGCALLLFLSVYFAVYYCAPAQPRVVIPFEGPIEFEFSPDSSSIVAVMRGYSYRTLLKRGEEELYKQIRVLDAATGKERFTIAENHSSPFELGFSPDGRILTTYSDTGDLAIREVLSGTVLWTLPYANLEIRRPKPHFAPDSRHFVLPDGPWRDLRGRTRNFPEDIQSKHPRKQTVFNTETGRSCGQIEGAFESLCFSQDSKRLATWQRDDVAGSFCVRLWDGLDLGQATLLHQFDVKAEQLFFIRDLNSFAIIRTVGPVLTKEWQMCEMTGGNTLSSFQYDGYGDGSLRLMQAADRTLILEQYKRYGESTFFVGCETQAVRTLGPFSVHLAVSPEGTWYGIREQEICQIYELHHPSNQGFEALEISGESRESRVLKSWLGMFEAFHGIEFSAHDRLAIISSLWNRPSRLFFEDWIPDRWNPLPRGSFVQLAVWDMGKQHELLNVTDCERWEVSPDETMVATVGRDNLLKIWRLPPDKAVGIVAAVALGCWLILLAVLWGVTASRRTQRPRTQSEASAQLS